MGEQQLPERGQDAALGLGSLGGVARGRNPGHTDTLARSVSKPLCRRLDGRAPDLRPGAASGAALRTARSAVVPPPAALTMSSGRLSCHACSRAAVNVSAGWAPESPNFRSITKNGTPVMPRARPSSKSSRTSSAYLSVVNSSSSSAGADPEVQPQRGQVVPAADVLALLEVVAEQAFLCGVLLPVGGGEVDQPVGGEAVGHHDVVETVVEALALGLLRHMLEHAGDLRRGHALAGAQVVQFGAVVVLRERGVQLVAAPLHLHGVAVRERRKGGFKAAFADVAPGAGDVGPDLNLHAGNNPGAPAPFPARAVGLVTAARCQAWGRSITKSCSTVFPSRKDLVPTFRKPDFS